MIVPKTIGARAKAVRKEALKTQAEMAEFLGVALGTWQKLERDEVLPSGETLIQFEKLGINPGWVLAGLGPKGLDDSEDAPVSVRQSKSPDVAPKVVQIDAEFFEKFNVAVEQLSKLTNSVVDQVPMQRVPPVVRPSTITYLPFRASAGGGSVVLDDSPGLELDIDALSSEILGLRRKNIRLIEIIGDSMLPTFLSGDVVLADTSFPRRDEGPDDGEIYVIRKEGELLVKRALWIDDRTLEWRSDNSDFAPVRLQGDEINQVKMVGKVVWLWRRAV